MQDDSRKLLWDGRPPRRPVWWIFPTLLIGSSLALLTLAAYCSIPH